MHHCNRLNYHTASIQCSMSHTRNAEVAIYRCYKRTSTTTNVVDVKCAIGVINRLRLSPTLLMTLRVPPPECIIVDMNHCGGWTQILKFRRDLSHHKTTVPGISSGVVFEILCLAILIQYWLVTDKQTDTITANTALVQHCMGNK